eukprot:PhF_6_TR32403/c0_g1_i1/m.48074
MSDYDRHTFETSPLTTFFYVLCKKPHNWDRADVVAAMNAMGGTSGSDTERRIPDTVVWENNIPKGWFTFDTNENQIVRRKMETTHVYQVMTHGTKDENEVVAFVCGKNNAKDESLFFEYLTKQSLHVLLFESKRAKGTVVLQKFMKPYNGQHVDTLQAVWSPQVVFVNRRQNVNSFKDTTLSGLHRCATFEGPQHLSRQVCVSNQLEKRVKDVCNDLTKHFHATDPKYSITRMVLYFVLSENSRLYMMYTPCVRVTAVNRQERVRTALELRSLFDTSGTALRRLLSTEGSREGEMGGYTAPSPAHTSTNGVLTDTANGARTLSALTSSGNHNKDPTSPHRARTTTPTPLLREPSSQEIWQVTDQPIFPAFRTIMSRSTSPLDQATPSSASPNPQQQPGGSGGLDLDPTPSSRHKMRNKHNLSALLQEYKSSTTEHRPLRSKKLRALRSLRHQMEMLEDEDILRDHRIQYLSLHEQGLSDGEKMELLHLVLQKQNAIGRDSIYNVPRRQESKKYVTTPNSSVTSSQPASRFTQSLEEIFNDFEYEVNSHFMKYAGQELPQPLTYSFPASVPREVQVAFADHLRVPIFENGNIEIRWRRHLTRDIRLAAGVAMKVGCETEKQKSCNHFDI